MQRAEVAIVGSGIIGCLTAREVLSRMPESSIAVLDRDAVANGATRRSAGLHVPRGSSPRVRRMADYSQAYYTAMKGEDPELAIHAVDMTVVAQERNESQLNQSYLPGAIQTRGDVVPGGLVRLAAGSAAWRVQGGQYADVQRVAQRVAWQLRPRVNFLEAVRVNSVEPANDEVVLGLSTGDTLRASRVVLAPGPWLLDPVWRHWVEPLGLRVKKVVALHIDLIPQAGDGAIVFEEDDAFLLPLHDRRHWLFSYTCPQWDVSPDRIGPELTPREAEESRAVLRRHAPELAKLGMTGRVFCDAYSTDRAPYVGPVEDSGLVVFAGAANGSGYRLAPAIAAEAAALVCPVRGPRSHA